MELTGKIKAIDETKSFGESAFRKREVVITTDEQYPQHILLEFTQDKCDLLNNYNVGDSVKIGINIRGREWVSPQGETKYFNTIQGWRIERGEIGKSEIVKTDKSPSTANNEEEHDDLPF